MTDRAIRSPRTSPATVIGLIGWRVAIGIVQEVSEYLADQKAVDVDVGQVVGYRSNRPDGPPASNGAR